MATPGVFDSRGCSSGGGWVGQRDKCRCTGVQEAFTSGEFLTPMYLVSLLNKHLYFRKKNYNISKL